MKKTIVLNSFLILLLSITVGCKIKQNVADVKAKEKVDVGGIVADETRNYSTSELEVGRRICANLKKKRLFFEKLDNNAEKFRFRGEITACDGSVWYNTEFDASVTNSNSTEPEYESTRDANIYFKDVATDQSGIMKSMCETLIQSDSVPNVLYSANYRYSIKLLIADGFDTYQIIKSQKNASGNYDKLSGESVALFSQKNPGETKFYGVEKERFRNTVCEGGKVKTVKQTWLRALTDFVVK